VFLLLFTFTENFCSRIKRYRANGESGELQGFCLIEELILGLKPKEKA
jgi:hypothetical protein